MQSHSQWRRPPCWCGALWEHAQQRPARGGRTQRGWGVAPQRSGAPEQARAPTAGSGRSALMRAAPCRWRRGCAPTGGLPRRANRLPGGRWELGSHAFAGRSPPVSPQPGSDPTRGLSEDLPHNMDRPTTLRAAPPKMTEGGVHHCLPTVCGRLNGGGRGRTDSGSSAPLLSSSWLHRLVGFPNLPLRPGPPPARPALAA